MPPWNGRARSRGGWRLEQQNQAWECSPHYCTIGCFLFGRRAAGGPVTSRWRSGMAWLLSPGSSSSSSVVSLIPSVTLGLFVLLGLQNVEGEIGRWVIFKLIWCGECRVNRRGERAKQEVEGGRLHLFKVQEGAIVHGWEGAVSWKGENNKNDGRETLMMEEQNKRQQKVIQETWRHFWCKDIREINQSLD